MIQQCAVTAQEAHYTQLQVLINNIIKHGGGMYIVAGNILFLIISINQLILL